MLKKLCFTLHKEHYSRAAPIWPDYIDEKSMDFGQQIRDKEWRHENPWQQIGY